jgi:uncharacterized protein (TIGR02246 family)
MNDRTTEATAKTEIRTLMDNWLQAVRTNDIKGIAPHYAPDVLAFDAIAQLQFKGKDAYLKHWEACLAMCPGSMLFEIRDLNVAAAGDVAFSHYLCRCGAKEENGTEKASWMRVTVGYRKTNGKWLIVHEHFSAPFDMESGKALFDLEP